MISLSWALLRDDAGFVVSTELVLVGTLAVLGLVVGMTAVRDAVTGELTDVASAISSADQSFGYRGFRSYRHDGGLKAYTAGSRFRDDCDDEDEEIAFEVISSRPACVETHPPVVCEPVKPVCPPLETVPAPIPQGPVIPYEVPPQPCPGDCPPDGAVPHPAIPYHGNPHYGNPHPADCGCDPCRTAQTNRGCHDCGQSPCGCGHTGYAGGVRSRRPHGPEPLPIPLPYTPPGINPWAPRGGLVW